MRTGGSGRAVRVGSGHGPAAAWRPPGACRAGELRPRSTARAA